MTRSAKNLLLALLLMTGVQSFAQHCPWDCSGMILLQTDLSPDKINRLNPVLVDGQRRLIADTLSGPGKEMIQPVVFLSYADFTKSRKEKIADYSWYRHDTAYHFAAGNYLVRFNYCRYDGKKLYLRFVDPHTRSLTYHYIEIPADKRISLHDHSRALYDKQTAELQKAVQPAILHVTCAEWQLDETDCSN